MISFKTQIIPSNQTYTGTKKEIDYKAICVFAALGFFLDTDTFWIDLKTVPIASDCEIDDNGKLVSSKPYFKWHYSPREITLNQAVTEFTEIFESIVKEQTNGRKVILPLSGGLDSRTQAAALKNIGADVNSYSYSFQDGHNETEYSSKIAKAQDFQFQSWTVKPSYLWEKIDELVQINDCYSEFTHPRQMAFTEKFQNLGDVFSLGHWGDVLFDDMGVPDDLSFDAQLQIILKKIVKKGGLELASALWKARELEGNFEEYLYERVKVLLSAIDIQNSANARIRAFKSMYWATRWTSVNISIFESVKPITLPYYDNRMCEFICTVPEKHLAGRKIQIEYLKNRAPKLAKISWQDNRPFNLYNYQWNKTPWNLPYRVFDKAKRTLNRKNLIQRNWELQFLGKENDKHLRDRLFNNPKLSDWIPSEIIKEFYDKFINKDGVFYSHSISMLLTLSLFSKHFKEIPKTEKIKTSA